MRKQGGKPRIQSMKNFLNSMRKQRRKPIIYCFVEGEKPLKSNSEIGEESQILIEDRNKNSGSSRSKS